MTPAGRKLCYFVVVYVVWHALELQTVTRYLPDELCCSCQNETVLSHNPANYVRKVNTFIWGEKLQSLKVLVYESVKEKFCVTQNHNQVWFTDAACNEFCSAHWQPLYTNCVELDRWGRLRYTDHLGDKDTRIFHKEIVNWCRIFTSKAYKQLMSCKL